MRDDMPLTLAAILPARVGVRWLEERDRPDCAPADTGIELNP